MRNSISFSWREKVAVVGFLLAVAFVSWVVLIRPVNYDWVPAGNMRADVVNILPNKTLLGPTYIKALVKLEDGSQVVVSLPANPNIGEGTGLLLSVKTDRVQIDKRAFSFIQLDDG